MRKLTADKLVRESEVKKHADLTDAINKKYGDSLSLPDSSIPKPKDANLHDALPICILCDSPNYRTRYRSEERRVR